jgi:hypothetical protein
MEKKYRMSGAVVAIGYILLIPSILGVLASVVMFVYASMAGGTVASSAQQDAISALHRAGVREPIVQKVIDSREIWEEERASLTPAQRASVDAAIKDVTASRVGTGAGASIVGGIALFFGVMSFVGGLLGWLLVMKKQVLQCSHCGATVAAS